MITVRTALQAVRTGWLFLLIGALAGVGIGAAMLTTRTPIYRASASLVTSAGDTVVDPGALNSSSYTQWRLAEYDALLRSSSFLSRVVEERGLGLSAGDLAERIESSSPRQTAVLTISATAPSPELAAALSNAVAQTMTEVIPEREKGIELRALVVSAATAPAEPDDTPAALVVLQCLYVGGIGGIAVAVRRERRRSATYFVNEPKQRIGAPQ